MSESDASYSILVAHGVTGVKGFYSLGGHVLVKNAWSVYNGTWTEFRDILDSIWVKVGNRGSMPDYMRRYLRIESGINEEEDTSEVETDSVTASIEALRKLYHHIKHNKLNTCIISGFYCGKFNKYINNMEELVKDNYCVVVNTVLKNTIEIRDRVLAAENNAVKYSDKIMEFLLMLIQETLDGAAKEITQQRLFAIKKNMDKMYEAEETMQTALIDAETVLNPNV